MLPIFLALNLAAVVDPTATLQAVCTKGYASAHRNVPESVKRSMYKAAAILPPYKGKYVIDHRCPLELGCMNVKANLQIQDEASGRRKDRVENQTWRAVCVSHKLSLDQGRAVFVPDRRW